MLNILWLMNSQEKVFLRLIDLCINFDEQEKKGELDVYIREAEKCSICV